MKKIEVPKLIEPWRIICAAQSEPDYSEERYILIYSGENVWDDVYAVIEGGHCSCFSWNDVEWDGVEYGRDELLKLAESKIGDSGWYCRAEQRFWKMVVMALYEAA